MPSGTFCPCLPDLQPRPRGYGSQPHASHTPSAHAMGTYTQYTNSHSRSAHRCTMCMSCAQTQTHTCTFICTRMDKCGHAHTQGYTHTHTCTHSPRCAHHTPCLCASHMPSNVRLPPMNLRSPQLVQVNSPCQPANQQLVHPARECYLPRAPSSAAGGHRKARPCDIPTPGGGSSSLGINTGGAVGLICWLAGVLNAPAVHPI